MLRHHSSLGILASLIFALVLSLTVVGSAGAASPKDPRPGSKKTITAQMVLDCVNMTADARKYADEHGYCGSKDGEVQPDGWAYGNCGASYIDLYNTGVSRPGRFYMRADSYYGWIARVDWSVLHFNTSTGYNSSFGASHWNGGGSTWQHTQDNYTDRGWVDAELYGNAYLAWGGVCAILIPRDTDYIN